MNASPLNPPLKNNLPHLLTSFIGREKELVKIRWLLQQNRLVTLTGTGGVGKTRLALQAVSQEVSHYRNEVWLVELAALSNPLLVPSTLAQIFSLKEEPGQPLLTTLVTFLQPRQTLILLDNCEHLIDECAR